MVGYKGVIRNQKSGGVLGEGGGAGKIDLPLVTKYSKLDSKGHIFVIFFQFSALFLHLLLLCPLFLRLIFRLFFPYIGEGGNASSG